VELLIWLFGLSEGMPEVMGLTTAHLDHLIHLPDIHAEYCLSNIEVGVVSLFYLRCKYCGGVTLDKKT
jgi:hypothetical protein